MIKRDCPTCESPLKAPDEYAGKTPRCPVCKTPVPAVAPTPEPAAKTPEKPKSVVDELLEDAARGGEPPKPTPVRREVSRRKPRQVAPKTAPAPRRRPFPVGTVVVFALSLLAVTVAAIWAFQYVSDKARERRLAEIVGKVSRRTGDLEAGWRRAEEAREKAWTMANEKDTPETYDAARAGFVAARQEYEKIQQQAAQLQERLVEWSTTYPDESRLAEARKKVRELVQRVEAALDGKQMKLGPRLGKDYVLFEGEWLTPEEKEKRFRKRMLELGMVQDEKTGEWITPAERNRRRGLVEFEGKWYPKDVAERLKAEAEAKAAMAKKREEQLAALEKKRREELLRRASRFQPDKPVWVLDDFEKGPARWRGMPWGHEVEVRSVKRGDTRQLLIKVRKTNADKVAVGLRLGRDFSSRKTLTLEVENAGDRNAKIAVAFQTDAFYESQQQTLRVGKNVLAFDLEAGNFKCEATGWVHKSPLKGRNRVRQIFLLIYRSVESQTFYVDNVLAKK